MTSKKTLNKKIYKIGVWRIEFPTTCNGRIAPNTAFLCNNWTSDFVTLYGDGRIGIGDGVKCNNKKVLQKLETLSKGLNSAK